MFSCLGFTHGITCSLLKDGQQELVPFRYDIELGDQTHGFHPDTLPEDKVKASLQMAEFGAIYKGKFDQMPKTHMKIVWEVQVNNTPPAKIQPVKPKVWVTTELLMNAGVIYKVD